MEVTDSRYFRNITFLLAGQAVTLFGTQIFTFYVSYFILRETGSGLSFGLNTALGLLPQLFIAPVGGFIADSYSRKKIIVLTDLFSGVVILFMVLLSALTGFKVYYLYIIVFILGIFSMVNSIALSACLPNIVTKDKLVKLNSFSQTAASLSRVSAPFIGGLLVEYADIRAFSVINAVSFLFASLMEAFIIFGEDVRLKKVKQKLNFPHFISSLKEGAQYTKQNKSILYLTLFFILFNVFLQFAYINPVPFIINNVFGLSPVQFGSIQGVASFGAIIASFLFAFINKPEKLFSIVITASAVMAAIWFSMGFLAVPGVVEAADTYLFIIYMALNFMFGAAMVTISIPTNILIQSNSDDEYRGRVMGIMNTVKSFFTPIAAILSGLILDLGAAFAPPVGGAFLLLIIVVILARRLK